MYFYLYITMCLENTPLVQLYEVILLTYLMQSNNNECHSLQICINHDEYWFYRQEALKMYCTLYSKCPRPAKMFDEGVDCCHRNPQIIHTNAATRSLISILGILLALDGM